MAEKETFMSEQERKQNDLYVVVISAREERDQLKTLCIKHNIPLTYPELFEEENIQPLWGINNDGVGLAGTVIARYTPKEHVFHSITDLEKTMHEKSL